MYILEFGGLYIFPVILLLNLDLMISIKSDSIICESKVERSGLSLKLILLFTNKPTPPPDLSL